MKLMAAALAATTLVFASSAFAQGTDQTSSNQSVPAQVRAGAQSTQPGLDPATAPVVVAPGTVVVAPGTGGAPAELPNAGGPAGGEAR